MARKLFIAGALLASAASWASSANATELILLLCVPFMLRTRRSREHFVALLSSASNLVKLGALLLIGLIGIVLYVFGLGRGHPIVIAAVLNLDPFWAAIIAYLAAGKKIPTSFLTFTLLNRLLRRRDAPRSEPNGRRQPTGGKQCGASGCTS
jgi:drug/metabolite transporter (DMT)-like permease